MVPPGAEVSAAEALRLYEVAVSTSDIAGASTECEVGRGGGCAAALAAEAGRADVSCREALAACADTRRPLQVL